MGLEEVDVTHGVQSKVECLFKVEVSNEKSKKTADQDYSVFASHQLNDKVNFKNFVTEYHATEKFDGTCCFVDYDNQTENRKPVLWARFDRKPNKQTEKKFKEFQRTCKEDRCAEDVFDWGDIDCNFKPIPALWKPAVKTSMAYGHCKPNKYGQIFGWNAVLMDDSQPVYKWHKMALTRDHNDLLSLLTLTPDPDDCTLLRLSCTALEKCVGSTFELIGTNINGNPYRLGNKKSPFLCYIKHGAFPLKINIAAADNNTRCSDGHLAEGYSRWFQNDYVNDGGARGDSYGGGDSNSAGDSNGGRDIDNRIEGIVWHRRGQSSDFVKLHRHHLKLKWPLEKEKLRLHSFKIRIDMEQPKNSSSSANTMLRKLYSLHGKTFDSISDIPLL